MIEAPSFVNPASAFAAPKRTCIANPGKASTTTKIWGNTKPLSVQANEGKGREREEG
jgi:hypothetical protein